MGKGRSADRLPRRDINHRWRDHRSWHLIEFDEVAKCRNRVSLFCNMLILLIPIPDKCPFGDFLRERQHYMIQSVFMVKN